MMAAWSLWHAAWSQKEARQTRLSPQPTEAGTVAWLRKLRQLSLAMRTALPPGRESKGVSAARAEGGVAAGSSSTYS